MTIEDRFLRIRELSKEQNQVYSGVIGFRQIAMLENIKSEFRLINADFHVSAIQRRIDHYSAELV